jgi:hypothetical protein
MQALPPPVSFASKNLTSFVGIKSSPLFRRTTRVLSFFCSGSSRPHTLPRDSPPSRSDGSNSTPQQIQQLLKFLWPLRRKTKKGKGQYRVTGPTPSSWTPKSPRLFRFIQTTRAVQNLLPSYPPKLQGDVSIGEDGRCGVTGR